MVSRAGQQVLKNEHFLLKTQNVVKRYIASVSKKKANTVGLPGIIISFIIRIMSIDIPYPYLANLDRILHVHSILFKKYPDD
eukprot:SAG11_NODE_4550_length_1854_cov_2.067806_1_plen_82_part_00